MCIYIYIYTHTIHIYIYTIIQGGRGGPAGREQGLRDQEQLGAGLSYELYLYTHMYTMYIPYLYIPYVCIYIYIYIYTTRLAKTRLARNTLN